MHCSAHLPLCGRCARSYPLDPPSVSFLTPIYHPNVDERGRICLDTLSLPPKGRWSPAMTLAALLTTVHQLMAYPNGQDGLVREVANVFNADRQAFDRTAREMTRSHAMEEKEVKAQSTDAAVGEGEDEAAQSTSASEALTAGAKRVRSSEAASPAEGETAAATSAGAEERDHKRSRMADPSQ